MAFITKADVEARNIQRVILKARTFSQNISSGGEGHLASAPSMSTTFRIDPDFVGDVFRDYIMPLTKEVEVEYLLARLPVSAWCQRCRSLSPVPTATSSRRQRVRLRIRSLLPRSPDVAHRRHSWHPSFRGRGVASQALSEHPEGGEAQPPTRGSNVIKACTASSAS